MRLRRAPVVLVLAAAGLLVSGAAMLAATATQAPASPPARDVPGPVATGARLVARATDAADNTDYGPPPGVTDPPAGHVHRPGSDR